MAKDPVIPMLPAKPPSTFPELVMRIDFLLQCCQHPSAYSELATRKDLEIPVLPASSY
jgi:hypothetical protein